MVTKKAYAKLNLGLKLLNRRSDGFWNILSVMQTIDLYDTLIFKERTQEIEIKCTAPDVPSDSENLIVKAAQLMRKRLGVDRGVHVEVEKRIPVGGGLGGGSSDAAATLRALNRLWNGGLGRDELFEIASLIGSDVPFFLKSGTAIVSGRGEVLEYINLPIRAYYVLIYPNFPVSTRWAYHNQKTSLTGESKYVNFIDSWKERKEDGRLLYRNLENDFERLVEIHYPIIREIREDLLSEGAIAVSLSGTGSTVYGVFKTLQRAQLAAALLRKAGRTIFICQPVC